MMIVLLAAVLCQDQKTVTIQFGDPDRSLYQKIEGYCLDAKLKIKKDPEAVLRNVEEILKLEGQRVRKTRPFPFERMVRIYKRQSSPGTPFALYPYQYRGRARMELAKNEYHQSIWCH